MPVAEHQRTLVGAVTELAAIGLLAVAVGLYAGRVSTGAEPDEIRHVLVVLAARPGVGAVTIALLFGLYSLIFGTTEIMLGIDVHRGGKAGELLRSIVSDAA